MREANLFTLAAAAVTLLGGCGGSQSVNAVMPNSVAANSALHSPINVLGALRNAHAKMPKDLYIADIYANAVKMLRNKSFRDAGAITAGIDVPTDVFLDKQGNLYVANIGGSQGGANVVEYAPGNTAGPSVVYTDKITFPEAVAADAHGNLFVADSSLNSSVNEYYQGLNHAVGSCPVQAPLGVAVDSSGDVFVLERTSGGNVLAEYPGGLAGCNQQVLRVTIDATAGGIALDASNNILLADGSKVAVIDPPYTSITGTIGSGFGFATNVRLNRKNTLAYVSDQENLTVTLVSYPSGTNVTVLGLQNGIQYPVAAADWPNAVY